MSAIGTMIIPRHLRMALFPGVYTVTDGLGALQIPSRQRYITVQILQPRSVFIVTDMTLVYAVMALKIILGGDIRHDIPELYRWVGLWNSSISGRIEQLLEMKKKWALSICAVAALANCSREMAGRILQDMNEDAGK